MLSVVTKHPGVPTGEFRRFMRDEYGPVYAAMPQVRSYVQHFLSAPDGANGDAGPDAVVHIAFDSPEAMREALDCDAYRAATRRRTAYMARIDARVLDAVVTLA